MGGSLRSSLSGSRPTSHSQGHGRPCLPRPHLRPRFRKTWMERFSKHLPQAKKKRPRNTPQSLKNVRATETATDVSILPREMSRSDRGVRNREALSIFQDSSRRRKKRDRGTRPRSLKNVRAKGLEPIRTKAPDPKSGLATNYNTLANPFRKTHNMKPIAEYDLVGSCRILCPKRNAKIVKDFQFSKPVRIFRKNTEKNTIFVHRKNK